jgi:hypothetical protein
MPSAAVGLKVPLSPLGGRLLLLYLFTQLPLYTAMAADLYPKSGGVDGLHTRIAIYTHPTRTPSNLDTSFCSRPRHARRICHPKTLGRCSGVLLSVRCRTIWNYHYTNHGILHPLRSLPIPPFFFPQFSERHKLQPASKQPTQEQVWDCFLVVLRNQVVATVFHTVTMFLRQRLGHLPVFVITSKLPPWPLVIRDLLLSFIAREVLFYYVHRLLHHKGFIPTFTKFIIDSPRQSHWRLSTHIHSNT